MGAMTNLGRTSSHGWEEQFEIVVQKATGKTDAKTNTSIQEAIDAERAAPWRGSGGAQDRAKGPKIWKLLLGASCKIIRGATTGR